MKTKKLRKLMSVLVAMSIVAMNIAGAFAVAAEGLEIVSAEDVTVAILEDHSETSIESLYDSYDVTATQGDEAINVKIAAQNVVVHENAENTQGYWVGFAVEAPEGATKAKGVFGTDYEENVSIINENGIQGIAFYINAGVLLPKTEATLQWFDGDTPLSEMTRFDIDIKDVALDTDDTPVIISANIVDNANPSRPVCDENKALLSDDGKTVEITTTKLALHKNGENTDGFWTGFAAVAPVGADFVKYTFGENAGIANVEDIDGEVGENVGVAFYTDAQNPKTNVTLQWFDGAQDGEHIALSNPVELTMNLDNVEYYEVNAEDVAEAIIYDNSAESVSPLYDDYRVSAMQEGDTISVTVEAENVVKHENANHTPGYWIGFAVEAPEGVTKAVGDFGTAYEENVSIINENGAQGIAFYINAGALTPKTEATLQWVDADGYALSEITTFNIDLSGVTLAIDYTPVIDKAKVIDKDDTERVIYEADSYIVNHTTNDNGTIVVDIAMQELAKHTSDTGEGYWTGFAVTAPADSNKMKYVFGNTADLDWSTATIDNMEENVIGEESGIAFYANAEEAEPKKYAMLQWFKDDEAVSNIMTFEMNLEDVKLNWIKSETVSPAITSGEVTPEVAATQCDGIITVALTAENVNKHENAEHTEGYWVGFAVEAPNNEAKAKVVFGEYVNDNMELEDISADKKGVAFYTNAGAAEPKTEATLQWIDSEGNPLSAPTSFVIDLTNVTLAELPYIAAEDVKAARVVDQANTSVQPYSSYSVAAEANEDGVIIVDIDMKNLKSHKNGRNESGYWTGFAVIAPDNAVTMRYAFATDKENLSMANVAVETGIVTVDEIEKNGIAFYTDVKSSPKKYARLQWFDENGEAITNATDFEMNLSGVRCYEAPRRTSGGGSSNYLTVKFNTNGGSAIGSVRTEKGKAISEPAAPSKAGFVFDGWYVDAELTQEYDFSAPVSKSFTLYAKWTAIEEGSMRFTDVDSNAWYYDVVKAIVEKGLMKGISETQFAPSLEVTRGMFVTILFRAAGEPETEATVTFVDVDAQQYYADPIVWASKNGIVNGITDTAFAPDSNITREQMAVILYRFAKTLGIEMENAEDSTYTDADNISDYAQEAIAWVSAAGIMQGNEDGSFAPDRNTSRAEAAAVFVRLLNLINQ